MTEDEAKTKTCHKTLAPVARSDGSEPWHSPQACIGSACMAWRELTGIFARELDGGLERFVPAGGGVDIRKEEFITRVTGGYCGLAGKP